MIAVKVDQLVLSNVGFVVLLKARNSELLLPIVIGAPEAQAISMRLNNVEFPRPLTHDLLKNILDFLECRLLRIEISDLKKGTFFASLILDKDGERLPMDCRPSDAIALALSFKAPIYVAEKVMDVAGQILDETLNASGGKGEPGAADKKDLTPREALEQELNRAISEERYEDAAHLRDELTHIKNVHDGN